MSDANYLFYNGSITKTGKLIISPDNRSFRYGDGFFETMKLVNGKIVLEELHMERLFSSLERMQFQCPDYFTPAYIREYVLALAKKNYHDKLCRIRLTIFRGDGGLYDVNNHFPHHLVQTWPLDNSYKALNENGLELDFYKDARKGCDEFSAIKTNNYLPSVMGALWARQHKLNDVVLLNPYDRVAEATIANVFIVKDGVIRTPPLSEGPVNGVMRRYLLKRIREEGMPHEVVPLQPDDLLQASEIFLTNSIYGIRWVKKLGDNGYTSQAATLLHKKFLESLF
jgi:aminodeoxychorismate lyase